MSNPKVAIILCTYNMGHYLNESLDSVMKIQYPNLQIIVVDDGSTDNTSSLVKRCYLQKVTYIYQENKGLFAARNVGIKAASNVDYYSIIDADDRVHPLKIWDEVAYLERFPDQIVCFSNLVAFEKALHQSDNIWNSHNRLVWDAQDLIGSNAPWGRIENPIEKIFKFNAFTSVSTIRAKSMMDVGLYDDKLKCSGDMDLAIRITRFGGIGFINKPRYLNRREGQGMTSYVHDRILTYMHIFEKVWKNSSMYREDELRYLKAYERECLRRALKGIATGKVDPKLSSYIKKEFLRNATWREILELYIIRSATWLGLAQRVAISKNRKRQSQRNAVDVNQVMSDLMPCFESIVPGEW